MEFLLIITIIVIIWAVRLEDRELKKVREQKAEWSRMRYGEKAHLSQAEWAEWVRSPEGQEWVRKTGMGR